MALMNKIATVDAKIKEMKAAVGLEENVSLDELVDKVSSGVAPTYKYGNIYNATGGPEWSMGYFNVLPDYTGEIPEIKSTSASNISSTYYKLDLSKLEYDQLEEEQAASKIPQSGCDMGDYLLSSESIGYTPYGSTCNLYFHKKVNGKRTGVRVLNLKNDATTYVKKELAVGLVLDENTNNLLLFNNVMSQYGLSTNTNNIKNLKIIDNVNGTSALLVFEVSYSPYGWLLVRLDKSTKTITHIRFINKGGSYQYRYAAAAHWNGNFMFLYSQASNSYYTTILEINGANLNNVSNTTHTADNTNAMTLTFNYGTPYSKVIGNYLVIVATGYNYKRDFYSIIDLTNKVQKDKVTTYESLGLKFIFDYNNPTVRYIINAVDGNIYRMQINNGSFVLDSTTLVGTLNISSLSVVDHFTLAYSNNYIDLNKNAFVFGGNNYSLTSEIVTKENYLGNFLTDVREDKDKIFYLPFDVGNDYVSYIKFDEVGFDSTEAMYLVTLDKTRMAPQYAYVGTVLEVRAPYPDDEWDSGEYTYELLEKDFVIYNHRKYSIKQLTRKGETPSDLTKLESM